jgi:predicted DNA binding CopG/RHH family protein
MKHKKMKIPDFQNEDQEREFWANHSPLDYFEAKKAKKAAFPKLKPSTKSVSIRLPEDLLAELKIMANKQDVPYQSLVKILLARQVAIEREFSDRGTNKTSHKYGKGIDSFIAFDK